MFQVLLATYTSPHDLVQFPTLFPEDAPPTWDMTQVLDEVRAVRPEGTKVGDAAAPLDEEEHVKGLQEGE